MRKLLAQPAVFLVVAGMALAQAGCTQIGVLKGQMALRDAVKYYQRQDYRQAAEKYEEALKSNPDLGDAYFYLGNSYDNLYKPSRKGEADNDALLARQVLTLDIHDPAHCLRLFKANREVGLAIALAFLIGRL